MDGTRIGNFSHRGPHWRMGLLEKHATNVKRPQKAWENLRLSDLSTWCDQSLGRQCLLVKQCSEPLAMNLLQFVYSLSFVFLKL